jgi:3-oxoacid CoA-transferase subunit A
MITNWLITGDCHGDMTRFTYLNPEVDKPEETAIIVLGDFSVNYFLNKRDIKTKQILADLGYTFYVVHGNHEARPNEDIATLGYDEDVEGYVWVDKVNPKIKYFKMFGEYNIQGYEILVLGGAYSVDKYWRIMRAGGNTNPKVCGWFADEQMTDTEREECLYMVKEHADHYNIVLSHTCPLAYQPTDLFLPQVNQSTVDNSTEKFLDDVRNIITPYYKAWLWGHYHEDRIESNRHIMLYRSILSLKDIIRWAYLDDKSGMDKNRLHLPYGPLYSHIEK